MIVTSMLPEYFLSSSVNVTLERPIADHILHQLDSWQVSDISNKAAVRIRIPDEHKGEKWSMVTEVPVQSRSNRMM